MARLRTHRGDRPPHVGGLRSGAVATAARTNHGAGSARGGRASGAGGARQGIRPIRAVSPGRLVPQEAMAQAGAHCDRGVRDRPSVVRRLRLAEWPRLLQRVLLETSRRAVLERLACPCPSVLVLRSGPHPLLLSLSPSPSP